MQLPEPDHRWIPFVKMLFGFLLVLVIATLAAAIALGKVHQDSSYGLPQLLGGLLVLAGQFAQWAFSASKGDKPE